MSGQLCDTHPLLVNVGGENYAVSVQKTSVDIGWEHRFVGGFVNVFQLEHPGCLIQLVIMNTRCYDGDPVIAYINFEIDWHGPHGPYATHIKPMSYEMQKELRENWPELDFEETRKADELSKAWNGAIKLALSTELS